MFVSSATTKSLRENALLMSFPLLCRRTFLKSPAEEPMWFSVTATFLFLLWTIALLW